MSLALAEIYTGTDTEAVPPNKNFRRREGREASRHVLTKLLDRTEGVRFVGQAAECVIQNTYRRGQDAAVRPAWITPERPLQTALS